MKVIEHGWKWVRPLGRRSGGPPHIVVHHQAGTGSTEAIHRLHLANGWSGIGYHYHVRLDGSVHRGRPEWAIGAHSPKANDSVGICFEGNYETRKTMPARQLASGRELLTDLRRRYPKATVKRHKDFVPTACPGKYFPLAALTKAAPTPSAPALVAKAKIPVLKQRLLWYAADHGVPLTDARVAVVDASGSPSTGWGASAQRLAWRVSGALTGVEQGTQPTVALWKALGG
ncbi:MAG TPA: N-acetylmuramoyl-L-alanine amidase [Gemmatimonadales bacterium]|nr:N-acetylmuramoyl-L-alanine amidase [Gemmatimonadales bacterium]